MQKHYSKETTCGNNIRIFYVILFFMCSGQLINVRNDYIVCRSAKASRAVAILTLKNVIYKIL